VEENKFDKAKEAMDYALKVVPEYNVPYDVITTDIAFTYYQIGETEKAKDIYEKVMQASLKNLNWYARLDRRDFISTISEFSNELRVLRRILPFFQQEYPEDFKKYADFYNQYARLLEPYFGEPSSLGKVPNPQSEPNE
jgi:tetratricopeptide (TPR) repeat protein